MIRCSICSKEAEYLERRDGPLCKRCWLGLKLFEFNPHRLGDAKRYLYGQKPRKSKKPKKSHRPESDVRFARLVSEENQIAPIEIPETVASEPRRIRIVKWYNR